MSDRTGAARALHLVSTADRRGAQVFATQLAASLGGPLDHRVVAVEPGGGANQLAIPALGSRRWDPAGLARLVVTLRSFDVLVAHGSSALLHGAAAGALARTPFIYRNIGDPASWGAVRAAQVRIGVPLRRAAAAVSLYGAAADFLGSRYRLARPVEVIPNAVPAFDVPTAAEQAARRDALGLDPSRRWCGYLGALSEEKGVLEAIRAVTSTPDTGLVVAGSGPLEDDARRLAAQGPPGSVVFAGVVSDPRDLLAAVDVVVMPSRTEGIPAAAIEAGLAGLPVVATAVGGVPDVVVDGVTGVLVEDTAAATLARAVDAAFERRDEWGAAARQRCLERFTMDAVGAKWSALIDEVHHRG